MAWGRDEQSFPKVVQSQRPTQPDALSRDVEVAAIEQVVTALEMLHPESVKRVLDYALARYGKPYRFDEGGGE